MKSVAARWLVRLYPARWRERYGEEFYALLCELPLTFAVGADTIAHAALLRRRPLCAALLALLVPVAAAAGLHGRSDVPAPSAMHTMRSALAPCMSYSSVSDSRFTRAARCLT